MMQRKLAKIELAKLCGISYVALFNILEKDAQPRVKTIGALATALGTTPQMLLTGEEGGPMPAKPKVVRESPPAYGGSYPITEDEPGKTRDMRHAIEAIARQTGLSKEEVLNSVCDAMKRKVLGETKAG